MLKNETDSIDLIGSLNVVHVIKRHIYPFSIDDLKNNNKSYLKWHFIYKKYQIKKINLLMI